MAGLAILKMTRLTSMTAPGFVLLLLLNFVTGQIRPRASCVMDHHWKFWREHADKCQFVLVGSPSEPSGSFLYDVSVAVTNWSRFLIQMDSHDKNGSEDVDEDCYEMINIIEPESEPEFISVLEWVGAHDRERVSGSDREKSACVSTFFVVAPANMANAAIQELSDWIQKSISPENWPGLSSRVFLVTNEKGSCQVHEVYAVQREEKDKEQLQHILWVNPVLDKAPVAPLVHRRSNFGELTIRATGVDPLLLFVYQNSSSELRITPKSMSLPGYRSFNRGENNKLVATGVNSNVLDYFAQVYNFSTRTVPADFWIEVPSDATVTATSTNAHVWRGIGKLLREGSADMSIDQSTFVPFRAKYFTLLTPTFSDDRLCIYFRQPPASSMRNIFTQPFQRPLWTAIISVFGFALSALTLLKYGTSRKGRKWIGFFDGLDGHGYDHDLEMRTRDYFLWLTSFLTVQGWHAVPKKTCLRMGFFTGSMLGLVLYTAYSANLVSLFAHETKPIKNLHEFLQSDLPLYADSESPAISAIFGDRFTISRSNNSKPIHYAEREVAVSKSLEISGWPSLSNTDTGTPAAYLSYADAFYPESSWMLAQLQSQTQSKSKTHVQVADADARYRFLCKRITELPITDVHLRGGMVLPKNSPYKEFFNYAIIRMYEFGLMYREQFEYINSNRPICDRGSPLMLARERSGLTLADMFTAFLIVTVGICGSVPSVVVLFCERVVARAVVAFGVI